LGPEGLSDAAGAGRSLDLDSDQSGGTGMGGGWNWNRAGWDRGRPPLLFYNYSKLPLHRMKRIPSGRRQKMGHRHERPLPMGWGWEAPQGLEVGVGTASTATLHLAPCSGSCPRAVTLFLPSLSFPPLQTLSLHFHSVIVPPPDLLHPSSPAGPQLPLSLFLLPF
jgi:hypothetical protein